MTLILLEQSGAKLLNHYALLDISSVLVYYIKHRFVVRILFHTSPKFSQHSNILDDPHENPEVRFEANRDYPYAQLYSAHHYVRTAILQCIGQ